LAADSPVIWGIFQMGFPVKGPIRKIAIVCGELSGDLYAGLLAEELKKLDPGLDLVGIGGPALRQAGARILLSPISGFGFSGVLRQLPEHFRLMKRAARTLLSEKPDIVVFLDNPGFNLRLAPLLGRIPKIYYIPPKIWAHGYSRIQSLRRHFNAVITIFPFEGSIYRKEGVPARFFGHPVADLVEKRKDDRDVFAPPGLDCSQKIIGLFPGSRPTEIRNILPMLIDAAGIVQKQMPDVQYAVSVAEKSLDDLVCQIISDNRQKLHVWRKHPYTLARAATLCLCASGTLNLELALIGRPMVVFYRMHPVDYALARRLVKLDFISPVNIICGYSAVPEFVQKFDRDELADTLVNLIKEPRDQEKQLLAFSVVRERVGPPGVSRRIARFLLNMDSDVS
jgi:lipid-A-disaccharide synthase